MPKNDPTWPEIGIFARPCWLIWCPVGELVGVYGARAVSCKTPIYFMTIRYKNNIFERVKKNHADLAWNSPDFDVEHGP